MKKIRENDENESDENINAGLGNDCQVEYRYFYIFSYIKNNHMMDIFIYLKVTTIYNDGAMLTETFCRVVFITRF